MNRNSLLLGLTLGFAATLALSKAEAGQIPFRGTLSATSVMRIVSDKTIVVAPMVLARGFLAQIRRASQASGASDSDPAAAHTGCSVP